MPDRASIAIEYGIEAIRIGALLNGGFAGVLLFVIGLEPGFGLGLACFALGFCLAVSAWVLLRLWLQRKRRGKAHKKSGLSAQIRLKTLGRLTAFCLFLSFAFFTLGCFVVASAVVA